VACRLCGKPLATAKDALPRGRRGASLRFDEFKRHALVGAGATPIELTKGERLTMGRTTDCDLPIPSQRVSRLHAEITWEGDVAILRDLGSENGTQVDGRAVREHRLADGEEISVGPYTCTYRCVDGRGSLGKLLEIDNSSGDTARLNGPALSGRLEEISLYVVLQALEFNEKTGTLELTGTGHEDGRLTLDHGVPVHASIGELTGERAVFSFLSHEQGEFRFTQEVDENLPSNLEGHTVTELLLNARERMDSRHTMPRRLADLGDLEDED
jgi:pSer/pThr/pTyr-binding forkhead associated (FHA) protein